MRAHGQRGLRGPHPVAHPPPAETTPRSASAPGSASASSSWTSTRTPTWPSSTSCASWRAPSTYLCVVGDDDQSIYRFRGAEVGNILSFPKVFPGTQVVRLERNYRSTQAILDAASAVVSHNTGRLGKTLWTENAAGRSRRWLASRTRTRKRSYCAAGCPGRVLGDHRDPLPHERPVPPLRETLPRSWGSLTASSARCVSTPARRSRTRWPTCPCW